MLHTLFYYFYDIIHFELMTQLFSCVRNTNAKSSVPKFNILTNLRRRHVCIPQRRFRSKNRPQLETRDPWLGDLEEKYNIFLKFLSAQCEKFRFMPITRLFCLKKVKNLFNLCFFLIVN